MKYYVYKIENNLNGKWYIGKRRHLNPTDDPYMGSGKLIQQAIKKHGRENFTKTIIEIFENNDDAANLEKKLVTKETISTNQSYNMHEGGHGGFGHLNTGDSEHIERARRGGRNSLNKAKNHPNWGKGRFKAGDERVKELSKKANDAKLKDMEKTPKKYEKIYSKISKYQSENNSMKDRNWYVEIDAEDYSNKKVFKPEEVPTGWIKISEHRDNKKRKNGVYGKFWIYNPITKENKYCDGEIPEGWYKGRKTEFFQK